MLIQFIHVSFFPLFPLEDFKGNGIIILSTLSNIEIMKNLINCIKNITSKIQCHGLFLKNFYIQTMKEKGEGKKKVNRIIIIIIIIKQIVNELFGGLCVFV